MFAGLPEAPWTHHRIADLSRSPALTLCVGTDSSTPRTGLTTYNRDSSNSVHCGYAYWEPSA
eukprot:10571865-Alexandrium_andersonii.AAC.1